MKKLLARLIAVLLAIVIVLVLAGFFWMNSIVKKGIETAGPQVTKVGVKVDGVSVSLFSGKGSVSGLVIGNPEGYKTPSAIKVGNATVAVKPASVFSDKIIVRSVFIQAPEITFEGGLGENNLKKILANVEAFTGSNQSQPKPGDQASQKKLQVDDLVISGGKINVSLTMMGGKSATVPLPDIHLTSLGTGAEGITPAELTQKVLKAIMDNTTKAVASVASELGKGVTDAVGKSALDGAGKAAKSVTDLFKKK